ncbi:peptide chain release factor N(5)-glutamine methyltransferase [Pseudemcibacter aquimaris]|uniref:peptide chain release factor N(5)-glutamine methyltransferase n=1 Tax=Pseudemcibacter aquimaris TaxID=2857064 RepID=UPI002012CAD4|nr:peptide chain release factor N(5)-glutamine methyltransferase [Pseudemcibacter aquimaris]MCC3861790.1 peptide chain release factor N(5)-glutamine methyltransferase [Pseudemcibacter aquimaris]WDU58545.1 peptide chain release factor N(5)-glutamine methyltransferase [Pseudemcibacter aquimaris]
MPPWKASVVTLATFKKEIEARLRNAGIEEAELDARLLIVEGAGVKQIDFALDGGRALSIQEVSKTEKLVSLREARIPMSQIFGEKEFWSLIFKVTKDTLTPRPDSETLIDVVLKSEKDKTKPLKILDLGTGTGCLLLTLLSEYKNARGVGVDASDAALKVAHENTVNLGLENRTELIKSNWFSNVPDDQKFDVIISNPPYIGLIEKPNLSPEVKTHEPDTALFAGEDGLDDYKKIAAEIAPYLNDDGFIVLEIGHKQAAKVSDIFSEQGYSDIDTFQDLGARDRALKISKP